MCVCVCVCVMHAYANTTLGLSAIALSQCGPQPAAHFVGVCPG
jgi:hypothetical protein